MDTQRLKFAGYAAIGWAALGSLNILLLMLLGAERMISQERIGLTLLSLMGLAFGVYVLLEFKALLNQKLNYSDLDLTILAFIGFFGFLAITNLLIMLARSPSLSESSWVSDLLGAVPGILLGLAGIFVGSMMLRIPGNLWGLKTFLAYAWIAAGIGFASVIFAPIGMLAGVVGSVILALIFLHAAEDKQPAEADM